MKALCLVLAFIFSCVFGFYAQDNCISKRLTELNAEWNTQGKASSRPIPNADKLNEIELIQSHLEFVVKELKSRSTDHLAATQIFNRNQMLEVLQTYWKEGIFPQNIYHDSRTPYFIDYKGTHCAVGHLIAQSGYSELAKSIHKTHNYAYLAEISQVYSEIEEWADQFGFSLKELKWIQPSYAPFCGENWCIYSINVFVNDGSGQPASNYDYVWSSTDVNQHLLEGLCPSTTHSVNVYDSLDVLVSPEYVKILASGAVSGNTVTLWDDNYAKFELSYDYAPNCQSVVQILPRYGPPIFEANYLNYYLDWDYLEFDLGDPFLVDSLCEGWQYLTSDTGFGECGYIDSIFISPENGYDFLNLSGDSLCFDQCFNITPPESNAEVLILLSDQYGDFGADDENAILINSGDYQACLPSGLEYNNQYIIKLLSEDESYNELEIPVSVGLEVSYATSPDSGFLSGEISINTSDEFEINSYYLGVMEQEAPLWNQLVAGEYLMRIDYDHKCTYRDTIEVPINLPISNDLNLIGDTLCAGSCFSSSDINNQVNNSGPRNVEIFLSDSAGDFGEEFAKSILIGYSGRDYTEFVGCIPEDIAPGNDYKVIFKPYTALSVLESATVVDVVIQNIDSELTSTSDVNNLCTGSAEISFESDSLITSTEWSSGETSLIADSLCAGWYNVTTHFGGGCLVTDSIQVTSELIPEINILSISTDTICEEECFEVNFESFGFPPETEFRCEFSDVNGDFENPTELQGLTTESSGLIETCYSNGLEEGFGYRIRILTNSQNEFSEPNDVTLFINEADYTLSYELGMLSVDDADADMSFQWLDCDSGDEVLAETNSIFDNGAPGGNYAVEIFSSGCSFTSECVEFEGITDNISDIESSNLKLYPNPASDRINIEIDYSLYVSQPNLIIVTNVLGEVIHTENIKSQIQHLSLDTREWTDGTYIIQIMSNDKTLNTQKLEVVH